MKKEDIEWLLRLGYTMAQISQLVKIQADGINISAAFSEHSFLIVADVNQYRTFREMLSKIKFSSTKSLSLQQKNEMFQYFSDGIDYLLPLNAGLKIEQALFVMSKLLWMKKNDVNYDITPILNPKYSYDICMQIWIDIMNGIDVNLYLNNTLSHEKQSFIRMGLLRGLNLSDDIVNFKFLKETDLDNIEKLHNNGYDYKDVLKKLKNTEKTVYVCEKMAEGIDLLPNINSHMTLAVIKDLGKRMQAGTNVSMLKSIPISNTTEIPLLMAIYEKKYPLRKCRNYGTETLTNILYALNSGLTNSQIDEILQKTMYLKLAPLFIDCYKYKQENYFELIEKVEDKYKFLDYIDGFRQMLNYNFENPEKTYDITDLILDDGKLIDIDKFEFCVKNIINGNLDNSLLATLKDFSEKQSEIILKTKLAGYDISCLLDNRLSTRQMNSIKTCLELGLNITKVKEYDLPNKYKESEVRKVRHYCNSDGKNKFYITEEGDYEILSVTY